MKELCFDISTWQGGINYQAIRERTNYCIIRGGFSTTIDNQFENHYRNLQGLNLGCYWYTYAKNESQAITEANKCLEVIKGKQFTLPIFLDIEDPSIKGLGKDKLNSIIRTFGNIIEGAGYYFGVYTNLNWYRNIISGSELNRKYDWWIAAWGNNAPTGVNYGVWQYTSSYNTFGVRLDANYIYKDYPTIIREAGLNHLDPQPTPTPTPPEPTPQPTPPEPSDELKIGDTVKIIGTGNGSSMGNSNTAYGIGYIRQILDIYKDRPYPYQVGNNKGTTGFYKADSLEKI